MDAADMRYSLAHIGDVFEIKLDLYFKICHISGLSWIKYY